MAQPDENQSHTANLIPRARRTLPRVSHACQRCRAKKAKCDQQQPCLNCVKHAVDCEYGIRKRSGRKKQQAYGDTARTPNARPNPAFTNSSHIRPDDSELREHNRATTLRGTSSPSVLQFLAALMLLTLHVRFYTSNLIRERLRCSGRHQSTYSGNGVLWHVIKFRASESALCVCPATRSFEVYGLRGSSINNPSLPHEQ